MALERRLHDSNSSSKAVRHVCFSSSARLTGDEKREFLFVEDGDELWGDDVMKTYVDLVFCLDIDGDEGTFNEMLQLLPHRASKAVLDHQLHILLFCFISHGNIAAMSSGFCRIRSLSTLRCSSMNLRSCSAWWRSCFVRLSACSRSLRSFTAHCRST